MVAFGKSLKVSRRSGWERAYLDYHKLKKILSELANSPMDRDLDVEPDSDHDQHDRQIASSCSDESEIRSIRVKELFFQELGEEIEKVSLFTLKMQGNLSEAIGHLRFRDDDTINATELFPDQDSTFRRHKRKNMGSVIDDIEAYIILGVELLFLIQYVGVNTLAVRKVLKKYNKIVRKLNKPEYSYIMGGKDDFHLQLIANSQSVSAIHSSLQSALVKFYLEDTLTTDSERDLKLFRFQSVIQASYVLRKNSEVVNQPFREFLSRKAMINTGSILGGIEGNEMRAMNEVLNFDPTVILSSNINELDQMWTQWIPQYLAWKEDRSIYQDNSFELKEVIKFAMEVLEGEEIDWHTLSRKGSLPYESNSSEYVYDEKFWGGIDTPSMILNLTSILLYTVNYYIIAPTANHYAVVLGADGAYGATLIGASSFSAIIAAILYSYWYTTSSFKSALLFSTLCPLCGNLIYGLAISYDSMAMAISGRFLCGFGSAEVINRQLISTCVSFAQITRASAFFVAASAMGMSIGPLIAAILDDTAGRDFLIDLHLPFTPAGGIIFNSVTSPGFVMAILWLLEFLFLLFFFAEPDRINGGDENGTKSTDSETTSLIKTDYGSIDDRAIRNDLMISSELLDEISDSDSNDSFRPKIEEHVKGFWEEIASVFSLLMVNGGLPVTFLVFCYIELADEVLISSCSMIVRRYFDRNASAAGYLVASLGALVLPANFVVEICSRRVSERFIMKLSIWFIIFGCFGIFNYQGLYYDVVGISQYGGFDPIDLKHLKQLELSGEEIGHFMTKDHEFPYDWNYGQVVYVTFLSAIFGGTIVLEGVTTSIMAQVTPSELNTCFLNSGLLATLIGTLGRVLSDSMITFSALLDIHIFIDFVNATFLPLLLLAIGCLALVNKYYDKLV